MPTSIPARKRPETVSIVRKILLTAAAILLIMLCHAVAAQADGAHDHTQMEHMQPVQMMMNCDSKGVSYYNYGHCRYHGPFYSKLKRWNTNSQSFSDSCCSGNECRVTSPLEPATPEFKVLGYTHMVLVDGDWYPIKLTEKQTGFTPDQFGEVKKHPLFEEFMQETHVCASGSIAPSEVVRKNPEGYRLHLIQNTGDIYCVVDGGDKY